jgi:Uma2 family endonuclease
MKTVTTVPRSLPLTRADLKTMPDDGRRHELIDGVLVVTPSPGFRHQVVLGSLFALLKAACPEGLTVLIAPFDVVLDDNTVLQPDLLVARRTDFTERDLPTAPLLAVEVLSPSTRRMDLTLKHARYEAAGCPSYWVVDPDQLTLTAWQLRGSAYVEIAYAEPEETVHLQRPFSVDVRPADLLA